MMNRVEALVRPELLVWARESAGYSQEQAAQKVPVKQERLAAWEAGEARPSIPQLRHLARIYRRPIACFYLPKPPKDFQALHDYRRLPGDFEAESPQLRLEIRKARYRRQVALDLMAALAEDVPAFALKGSLSDPGEDLASRIREALGVSLDEQVGWGTPYAALNGWRAAVERLGVLVFQASGIEVSEMRGFSLGESPLPVIVVNVKDHPHGRIFSLLHELGHLILHRGGLCNLRDSGEASGGDQRVEVFCNLLAGAILMPSKHLLEEPVLQRSRTGALSTGAWSDGELAQLASRYRVSREAMLRRLLVLGKTTDAFYRSKRLQFLAEYEHQEGREPSKGGPSRDRIVVSAAGPSFVRLVLNSFYQEKITSSDLSDYLEVRLKWLPKIEEAVFGRQQGVLALT